MGLNSQVLRRAAKEANVSWDYQPIMYRGNGIGYKKGDIADATSVKDEIQKLIGYRPVEIDEPTIDTNIDETQ
jgi:hypothetical protein